MVVPTPLVSDIESLRIRSEITTKDHTIGRPNRLATVRATSELQPDRSTGRQVTKLEGLDHLLKLELHVEIGNAVLAAGVAITQFAFERCAAVSDVRSRVRSGSDRTADTIRTSQRQRTDVHVIGIEVNGTE